MKEKLEFNEEIDSVVFDLDGTIYYGDSIIDGVIEVLEYLNEKNKKIFYLTNNSSKTRVEIFKKLINMGISCKLEEVYTSGYLSAIYLKNKGYKNIFVLGSEGLKSELVDMGISITNDEDKSECVLIGYDTKFNYEDLSKALNIALKGKTIIACNKEKHYPGENARRLPGCGAMVGAIEMCCDRNVDYVIGKPNALMLDVLATKNNLNKLKMVMIGDTYESDIIMANDYGCKSILYSTEKIKDTNIVTDMRDIINLIK